MGRRLKMAKLILIIIRGAARRARKGEPISLAAKDKRMAKIKFEAGPAKAIIAESRFGFRRLNGSKGTGLPQPKRNRSNIILPTGSR